MVARGKGLCARVHVYVLHKRVTGGNLVEMEKFCLDCGAGYMNLHV